MAQPFNKTITREVTFRSSVRGMPDRTFTLDIGPRGIFMRKKNEREGHQLSWFQVVSMALVHMDKAPPASMIKGLKV